MNIYGSVDIDIMYSWPHLIFKQKGIYFLHRQESKQRYFIWKRIIPVTVCLPKSTYIYIFSKKSLHFTMTKTSSFLLFLVKTCFISIVRTEQKNRFSLVKLMVYLAFSFGFLVVNSILSLKVQASIKDAHNDNGHQLTIQVQIYN